MRCELQAALQRTQADICPLWRCCGPAAAWHADSDMNEHELLQSLILKSSGMHEQAASLEANTTLHPTPNLRPEHYRERGPWSQTEPWSWQAGAAVGPRAAV